MRSRGETTFVKFPRVAAALYGALSCTQSLQRQAHDIAALLVGEIERGRVLDVGTGPGRLLVAIHHLNPALELYGLDISQSMIELARENLADAPANLRIGSIAQTDYESDFFDLVTCTGSFYLWDDPKKGLEEIHRILKPGRRAYLFETRRDHDKTAFRQALRANLRQEGLAMKLVGPLLLGKAFQMGYRTDEVEDILRDTSFSSSHQIEHVTIAGLPVWMRIQLARQR
ncbi:MAG: class I SAM-dependent methyltransferase [Anaerolineales bacterium]|nr:class I SAM-dependent methyltransferase [Anaerolineales bacterium]